MTSLLEKQILERSQEISTDALAMSIGEVVSLYQNGEIDIHPEFQRYFRWTDTQKSNFIESLLLGIPIPSLFISQRQDGVWELVDGLQRISTILQLTGDLKTADGNRTNPLVLKRTQYLPELEGLVWESDQKSNALPSSAKLKIRRSRLDLKIVLSTSDARAKFELFRRLNTGGSIATDQEVRNCLMLMSNPEFFQWFMKLGKNLDFQACLPLTERAMEEAYDYELLTRFVVLRKVDLETIKKIDDLGEYLTEKILELSMNKNFDYSGEGEAFNKTFAFLATSLGEDAFRKYDIIKGRPQGSVLVSLFEVMGIGLGFHADFPGFGIGQDVVSIWRSLWAQANMQSSTGSGISASLRIPRTLALGRDSFAVS